MSRIGAEVIEMQGRAANNDFEVITAGDDWYCSAYQAYASIENAKDQLASLNDDCIAELTFIDGEA